MIVSREISKPLPHKHEPQQWKDEAVLFISKSCPRISTRWSKQRKQWREMSQIVLLSFSPSCEQWRNLHGRNGLDKSINGRRNFHSLITPRNRARRLNLKL